MKAPPYLLIQKSNLVCLLLILFPEYLQEQDCRTTRDERGRERPDGGRDVQRVLVDVELEQAEHAALGKLIADARVPLAE